MSGVIGPVLITGGAGFLGRALTAALLSRREKVVTLDLSVPDDVSGPPGLTRETGDIRNRDDLRRVADNHRIRAIVHLAALVIPDCRANPVLGAEVNVIGHINMFELARDLKIRRLVYTSSTAARPRGDLDAPANLYGVYKRCCEDIAKVYFTDHGVPSIGLRPNVVYGPGRENGETAAITLAMRAAAEDRTYELPFRGEMCFQHVDEVTDIMLRCLLADNDAPLVTDLTMTTRSIDDVISAIFAVRPGARITAAPVRRFAPTGLDNTPLIDLLGPWDSVPLEEGVRRTIAAFATNRVPVTRE